MSLGRIHRALRQYAAALRLHGDARYGRVSFGQCATLVRFNRHVTDFVVTPAQARKVRQKRGTLKVNEKAIERASAYCRR